MKRVILLLAAAIALASCQTVKVTDHSEYQ